MEAAAVAALVGMGDPMRLLALPREDWAIASAVLQRAVEIDNERRKSLVKMIGVEVANSVAQIMSH